MSGLRVVPFRRHGLERLYVSLPDGAKVAWFDRDAARVTVLRRDLVEDVLQALTPYLAGEVTVGPPPVPTPAELARLALHPDDDLAPNRPGEAVHTALDRERPPALRLRPDARRRALAAQETVGDALDALDGAGWRTLHSIPPPLPEGRGSGHPHPRFSRRRGSPFRAVGSTPRRPADRALGRRCRCREAVMVAALSCVVPGRG